MTDLLSGQVQLMFRRLPSSLQHIRSGKLRALAGDHGGAPSAALPDIPTVGRHVPGYEASSWYGVRVSP